MARPLLIVGLDGASFDVIRPWVDAGVLPELGRLMSDGGWGPLKSTLPAATFPAWTSMVTGVNPGRHGVLDFTERVPGTLRVRFVNGSRHAVQPFWERAARAGRRVVIVTVPATYPPDDLPNGVMVSGFDTPLTAAVDGRFVSPRDRWPDIRRQVGRVPFADFQEMSPGPGWHARALASLLDGVERRTRLTEHLIARENPDLCMVVYGESDTVSHHFWRFHDPRSPRHAPSAWHDAIRRVYERLDAAIGRLRAAMGDDTTVVVVSDHGSGGAGDRVVHLNRFLEDVGLLRFAPRGGHGSVVRGLALRAVPFRWQAALLRRLGGAAGWIEGSARFGRIDWGGTTAYSEELDYHPAVWLNLAGREPHGRVDPARYLEERARVAAALGAWCDGQGRPVVERVWPREDVYHGPFVDDAPDLLLEIAEVDGYSPSVLRSPGAGPALVRLEPSAFGAGKGAGMNGTHRPSGVLIASGPGVRRAGGIGERPIVDVAATLLALSGAAIPRALDGRPVIELLEANPTWCDDAVGTGRPRLTYDERDAQEVASRLRALGYLEPGGP